MRIKDYLSNTYHESNHESVDALSPIYLVLETAREKFCYHLDESSAAFEYLTKVRGLSPGTIEKFQLGFAPEGYTRLVSQAKSKRWQFLFQKSLGVGLSKEQLEEQLNAILLLSGLTARRDTGEMYDRFRNRVIIPIRDKHGQVISFGGRIFDSESPSKYINGSDSPVFNKRDILFNLDVVHSNYLNNQKDFTSKSKLPRICAVEGYMDVISLNEFGIENSVGTMGTAINSGQLNTLFHYTDHIDLCFDGDNPGQIAAKRAVNEVLPCLNGTRTVRITLLPDGHDPDSFLKENAKQSDKLFAKEMMLEEFERGEEIDDFLVRTIFEDNPEVNDNLSLMNALIIDVMSKIPSDSIIRERLEKKVSLMFSGEQEITNEEVVDYFVKNVSP